jgi:hypothetical protein
LVETVAALGTITLAQCAIIRGDGVVENITITAI